MILCFYFIFHLSTLSLLFLFVTPSFRRFTVSKSHLPTLNQQAAEDCGNPWNRRDRGCRQEATATLECGASEEIRAASPASESRGMQREGGREADLRRVRRKHGEQKVCEWVSRKHNTRNSQRARQNETEKEGRGDLKREGGHTGDGKPALFLFAFHLHPWPYRPIGLGAKPRA